MKLRSRWIFERIRTSLWVVPMGIVFGMIVLAQSMLHVDSAMDIELEMMEGAGVAGARGMFQAVAGSMITLAGLVFSMTLVVLSQVSGQYSSRVLRNFLGDRVNQVVLGVFLGVFAYCLVVLRGMGDDEATLPALTVLGGMLAALAGVVFLIYFIHHVARSMQVEHIVESIQDDTLPVIDRLYPETEDGTGSGREADPPEAPGNAQGVEARASGYVQDIDLECLSVLAVDLGAVVHIPHRVGDFITEGMDLVLIDGGRRAAKDSLEKVQHSFTLGRTRTIQQDPSFGIRQLVDIAMKALSPGVNDTTSAILVLDRLAVLLRRLGERRMPARGREVDGCLRLVVARPDWEEYVGLAFDQIRQWGGNNPAVLGRMLQVIGQLLPAVRGEGRRDVLLEHARRVMACAEHRIEEACDLEWLQACHHQACGSD